MGILNVTPDSFSDGGKHDEPEAALERALAMLEEGAAIIDIGGESTRPGADPVSAEEECERVLPVIAAIRRECAAIISIDTAKAAVAESAVSAGAHIINDVSACTMDPAMLDVVRASSAGVVLMHMQGEPRTMQDDPSYADVVSEVCSYLEERAGELITAGVARNRVVIDPGIGFGKTTEHNLDLLRSLDRLVALGFPVLVGLSRKRFLGELTGRPADARTAASVAGAFWAACAGAMVLRVHDVKETRDALSLAKALREM
jgi:dihydropteroate synthase